MALPNTTATIPVGPQRLIGAVQAQSFSNETTLTGVGSPDQTGPVFFGLNITGPDTPFFMTTAESTAILDIFTDVLQGLVPASGGGTTNFLRADGTWAAVDLSSVTYTGSGGIDLVGQDFRLTDMDPGTVKGRQIDAATGSPVDLSPLELGEIVRCNTVRTITLTVGGGSGSGGEYTEADVEMQMPSETTHVFVTVSGTGVIEIAGTASENLSGHMIVWAISDGDHATASIRFLHLSTETATSSNRYVTPSELGSVAEFTLVNRFDTVTMNHSGGNWRAVATTSYPFMNTQRESQFDVIIHDGSRYEVRRLSGNDLTDASIDNPKLADMAPGTVKGRQIDAVTGQPQDLSPLEVGEIVRRDNSLTLNLTGGTGSGAGGVFTDADITIPSEVSQVIIDVQTATPVEIAGFDSENIDGHEVSFFWDVSSSGPVVFLFDSTEATATRALLFPIENTSQTLKMESLFDSYTFRHCDIATTGSTHWALTAAAQNHSVNRDEYTAGFVYIHDGSRFIARQIDISDVTGALADNFTASGGIDRVVDNFRLSDMGQGTVKGTRADDATGAPVDLTGREVGEIARYSTVQSFSVTPGGGSGAGGVYTSADISLNPETTDLVLNPTAASSPGSPIQIGSIGSSNLDGHRVRIAVSSANAPHHIILRHEFGGSTDQISLPEFRDVILTGGRPSVELINTFIESAVRRWVLGSFHTGEFQHSENSTTGDVWIHNGIEYEERSLTTSDISGAFENLTASTGLTRVGDDFRMANIDGGVVKGRQIDAVTGAPVDLTPVELGEIVRCNTVRIITLVVGGGSGSGGEYTEADAEMQMPSEVTHIFVNISGTGIVEIAGTASENIAGHTLAWTINAGDHSTASLRFLHSSTETATPVNRYIAPSELGSTAEFTLVNRFDTVVMSHTGGNWRVKGFMGYPFMNSQRESNRDVIIHNGTRYEVRNLTSADLDGFLSDDYVWTGEHTFNDTVTHGGALAASGFATRTDTGVQTNWTVGGTVGDITAIRWSGGSSLIIDSIVPVVDRQLVNILNIHPTQLILVRDQTIATGTAANRIALPRAAELRILPGESMTLWYDNNSLRWRVWASSLDKVPVVASKIVTRNASAEMDTATASTGIEFDTATAVVRSRMNIISSTLPAGVINNFNPAGLSTAAGVRITPNAANQDFTGMVPGYNGQRVCLMNVGTVAFRVFSADVRSTASNRFLINNGGSPETINVNRSKEFVYDSVSSRWREISQ